MISEETEMADLGAHPFQEKRILKLNPQYIDTLKPGIKEWDGKEVTVLSWHGMWPNSYMAKLFPDDEKVGFIKEFMYDIPESELI